MLKKTMKWTDYDGNPREEDFYFNLTKAELMEMTLSISGGLDKYIERITKTQDTAKLIELFKEIIIKSFGVKSDDGKRFIKKPELVEEFTQTEAYSDLFTTLATDDKEAAAFINGIMPKELLNAANEVNEKLAEIPKQAEVVDTKSAT